MTAKPKPATRPAKKQTRRTISKAAQAKIAELARQDMPRNEIARQIGVSAATVTKYAKQAGVTFDRSATEAATRASKIDLASRRAALVDSMMTVAEESLAAVQRDEVEVVQVVQSGKVIRTKRKVDQTDRRNALTNGGIAFDKATKLLDRDSGVDGATSTLMLLESALANIPESILGEDETV